MQPRGVEARVPQGSGRIVDAREHEIEVLLVRGETLLLTDALARVFAHHQPIRPVAEPLSEVEAPEAAAALRPNVVLLDAMGWSCERVAEVVGRIVGAWGFVRVLVLASPQSRTRTMVAAVDAGASGVLSPSIPVDRLVANIEKVARGERLVDAEQYLQAVEATAQIREAERDARERLASLTDREQEVLGCLADGLRTDEIAQRFAISPRTVETHVHNILQKLYVRTRTEAVAFAMRSPESRVGPAP